MMMMMTTTLLLLKSCVVIAQQRCVPENVLSVTVTRKMLKLKGLISREMPGDAD